MITPELFDAAAWPGGFSSAALAFPFEHDTLIRIGPVAIRWYALAYIAGMILGWLLLKRLTRAPDDPVGNQPVESLLNVGIIGIIIGGRLGYVLAYNLPYYLDHPLEALQIWKGGMSFHGGFIGMMAAIFLVARHHRIRFLALADMVAIAAPIGLFLGRLANFVNCELYGRVTDLPWGVAFNRGVCINPALGIAPAGDLPRHPSQIYEALGEGLILFLILLLLLRLGARRHAGVLAASFLIGYGTFRSLAEMFREPDGQLGFLSGGITMGQALSLPMIVAGLVLILLSLTHRRRE